MKGTIFLIHWNAAEAEELAKPLCTIGWEIEIEAEDGARGYNQIKANPPTAVVIYLSRLPSHGRETAYTLRSVKATREIPIIFVDGSKEAIEKTRTKVPDAIYTTSDDLQKIILKVTNK